MKRARVALHPSGARVRSHRLCHCTCHISGEDGRFVSESAASHRVGSARGQNMAQSWPRPCAPQSGLLFLDQQESGAFRGGCRSCRDVNSTQRIASVAISRKGGQNVLPHVRVMLKFSYTRNVPMFCSPPLQGKIRRCSKQHQARVDAGNVALRRNITLK